MQAADCCNCSSAEAPAPEVKLAMLAEARHLLVDSIEHLQVYHCISAHSLVLPKRLHVRPHCKFVLASVSSYSKVPLQSEGTAWLPIALSWQRECRYTTRPCITKPLNHKFAMLGCSCVLCAHVSKRPLLPSWANVSADHVKKLYCKSNRHGNDKTWSEQGLPAILRRGKALQWLPDLLILWLSVHAMLPCLSSNTNIVVSCVGIVQ